MVSIGQLAGQPRRLSDTVFGSARFGSIEASSKPSPGLELIAGHSQPAPQLFQPASPAHSLAHPLAQRVRPAGL